MARGIRTWVGAAIDGAGLAVVLSHLARAYGG